MTIKLFPTINYYNINLVWSINQDNPSSPEPSCLVNSEEGYGFLLLSKIIIIIIIIKNFVKLLIICIVDQIQSKEQ